MNFSEVKYLFSKEFQLELRRKSGINSILLFVVATTFVSFLAIDQLEQAPIWNALFWIIILFANINAANNTFRNDSENTQLYLNQLAHPNSILIAKTLYNAFLMSITGVLNYLCYSLFLGNLISNHLLFIALIIVAALGFAAVLSLTNAISSKASFNNSLMPILSLPLLVPFFIILVAQTNHLIGNKEYHDFNYSSAREGMETEIICSNLIAQNDSNNQKEQTYFLATDLQQKTRKVAYVGDINFENNQPIILKGKEYKGIFYASSIWNKANISAISNVKYYGALVLITIIVLLVGQFLFPKIAKF